MPIVNKQREKNKYFFHSVELSLRMNNKRSLHRNHVSLVQNCREEKNK